MIETIIENNRKFISGYGGDHYNSAILIINDYKFYATNEEDIVKFCDQCLGKWERRGMVIFFENEQDRLLFLLRFE